MPSLLQTWFGRPAVTVKEFLAGGDLAYNDIGKWWVPDTNTDVLTDNTVVFPCSRVRPMGYSWSSAVEQDVSLGLLRVAGFSEEQVLSVEPPPDRPKRVKY